MKRISLLIATICLLGLSVQAQLKLPPASPKATLTQGIGPAQITITYSRPSVKGREVWGGLVPLHENAELHQGEIPWRCGANDNTVITFSEEVLIEGQKLAAGTYGLHMLPSKSEWTIIFSHNSTSWGSFFYKPDEDALRVKVTPKANAHHEVLSYDVIDHNGNEANIVLKWEKLQVPIKVSVDKELSLTSIRNQLRNTPGFTWQGWNAAANYCIQNNTNLEEGLAWAQQAVNRGQNFTTLSTQSTLLGLNGKEAEAQKIMETALTTATKAELNVYGYQLLNTNRQDEAIEIFKLNTERNPEDPNVWDSYGEGLSTRNAPGDKKAAIKAFKKSLSLNPPANVRANSMRLLETLGVDTEKM
ncbi:MAG: DUF2911 domain-containing protein [Bacteroidota bacterium]